MKRWHMSPHFAALMVIGLLCFAVLVTAGCDPTTRNTMDAMTGSDPETKEIPIVKTKISSIPSLYFIEFEDGTRCVASWEGGVDCDWQTGEAP